MDSITTIAVISIIMACLTVTIGCITPAIAEGKAIISALTSLSQQPDAAPSITRTLFVGLAMVESLAIYCLVIAMILIFTNPFWSYVIGR